MDNLRWIIYPWMLIEETGPWRPCCWRWPRRCRGRGSASSPASHRWHPLKTASNQISINHQFNHQLISSSTDSPSLPPFYSPAGIQRGLFEIGGRGWCHLASGGGVPTRQIGAWNQPTGGRQHGSVNPVNPVNPVAIINSSRIFRKNWS